MVGYLSSDDGLTIRHVNITTKMKVRVLIRTSILMDLLGECGEQQVEELHDQAGDDDDGGVRQFNDLHHDNKEADDEGEDAELAEHGGVLSVDGFHYKACDFCDHVLHIMTKCPLCFSLSNPNFA